MGFTEEGVRVLDSDLMLHPLINLYFTAASCLVIVAVGWWITDRIIEPRLSSTELDGDKDDMPQMPPMERSEERRVGTEGRSRGATQYCKQCEGRDTSTGGIRG